jgi:hypothetical protein
LVEINLSSKIVEIYRSCFLDSAPEGAQGIHDTLELLSSSLASTTSLVAFAFALLITFIFTVIEKILL